MRRLRTILITLLVIAIPMPALAGVLGTPHCMPMATMAVASDSTDSAGDDAASSAQADTCCDQCTTCEAPCATGAGASAPHSRIGYPQPYIDTGLRTVIPHTAPLPAHPEDLIRPPITRLT